VRVDLQRQIHETEEFIRWLDAKIDGLEIPGTKQAKMAGCCLDVALEHQKAVVVLAGKKIYSSVLALLRPLNEAYVRGAWLHRCASDQDIDRYEKGKRKPSEFGFYLDALEQTQVFKGGTLSKAKEANWKTLNDFTHSGIGQVSRRFKEDSIQPNYSETEISYALDFANAYGALAAIEICCLANNATLAEDVLKNAMQLINQSDG